MPTATAIKTISDGQPQAPTGNAVKTISDGQPQASTENESAIYITTGELFERNGFYVLAIAFARHVYRGFHGWIHIRAIFQNP